MSDKAASAGRKAHCRKKLEETAWDTRDVIANNANNAHSAVGMDGRGPLHVADGIRALHSHVSRHDSVNLTLLPLPTSPRRNRLAHSPEPPPSAFLRLALGCNLHLDATPRYRTCKLQPRQCWRAARIASRCAALPGRKMKQLEDCHVLS